MGEHEYESIQQMQGSMSRNAVPQPALRARQLHEVLNSYAIGRAKPAVNGVMMQDDAFPRIIPSFCCYHALCWRSQIASRRRLTPAGR